jgi:hypothetical protein
MTLQISPTQFDAIKLWRVTRQPFHGDPCSRVERGGLGGQGFLQPGEVARLDHAGLLTRHGGGLGDVEFLVLGVRG